MNSIRYDLVVVGAGSGGISAASLAAKHKLSVLLIDDNDIGGTCVNRGCVPKKLLWYSADVSDMLGKIYRLGYKAESEGLDWNVLKNNIDSVVTNISKSYIDKINNKGVKYLNGKARLLDQNSLLVDDIKIEFQNLIIATGAEPVVLDIPGHEEALVSDDIFKLEKLPTNMVIIGGGYIAVEMASILNKLGVKITLIQRSSIILKNFDTVIVKQLQNYMRDDGIDIILDTQVKSMKKNKNIHEIVMDSNKTIQSEAVMFATGRRPNLNLLDGFSLSVTCNEKKLIVVDENYKTNINNIYAIGDIIDTPHLTPVAKMEAKRVIQHIIGLKNKTQINYSNIPTTVFSLPPFSSTGLTIKQANNKFETEVFEQSFSDLKSSITQSTKKVFIKLIFDKKTSRLLGANMLGDGSHEIIQMLSIAIESGVTKDTLQNTMPLHPSIAEEFIYLIE